LLNYILIKFFWKNATKFSNLLFSKRHYQSYFLFFEDEYLHVIYKTYICINSLNILYYILIQPRSYLTGLRYGKRVKRRKKLVKNSRKKNENELIKTSTFSASSISTECERSTIHFSTLSFDVRSFNPLALRCKKISPCTSGDCIILEFTRHHNTL